jgi:ATP-dependent DNA helicase PIF1
MVALPFAFTGIAANLLKGGRTIHSGFRLPVPLLDGSASQMAPNSPDANLLRISKVIIIDEISMLTKDGLRCIDMLLRDVMDVHNRLFGGKVIVLTGDFRQTLPVIPKGTKKDIIQASVKSSPLWRAFSHTSLSQNMRSNGQNAHNQWLLEVGSGSIDGIVGLPEDMVEIPSEMIKDDDIIESVYGRITDLSFDELKNRVILSPKNVDILEMNRKIIDSLEGQLKIYLSSDSVVSEDISDEMNYPVEILNEMTPSGMPPHVLVLKPDSIIMLLRNLNPRKGLCNGTRMKVIALLHNAIRARLLDSNDSAEDVFIPRINLITSDVTLPFKLKRIQFPVSPAYAMTINKAQGQSFEHVGIYLKEPVFAHGQLYVALTRSRSKENIKIKIANTNRQGTLSGLLTGRRFTPNVVYKEILN